MIYGPNLTAHLFLYIKFYWNIVTLVNLHTVCACFHSAAAKLSSWEETIWPESWKYLLYYIWSFIEKLPISAIDQWNWIESRNRPALLWTIGVQQRGQDNSGGERIVFQQWFWRKTGALYGKGKKGTSILITHHRQS